MRVRVSPEVLRIESQRVDNFCLNHLASKKSCEVTVREVYKAYKAWLKSQGFPKTELSLDGFGRLLPKVYARKYIRYDGHVIRAIVGADLV